MPTESRGKTPSGREPRYPVESVSKAGDLLKLFIHSQQLRLSDVHEQIGVSPSTAHRLLTTMAASGLVQQNATTRCYEPGEALLELAGALKPAESSEWGFFRPFLVELSTRVGETVSLVKLVDTDAAFVESVEARAPLRVGSRLGAVMPASCVSGGKILLAQLSDDEIRTRYPDEALATLTPNSIATRTALLSELRKVRQRGSATNFGESEFDVSGVAVAMPASPGRPSVALAVAAPKSRLAPGRVKAIVEELHKTAGLAAPTT